MFRRMKHKHVEDVLLALYASGNPHLPRRSQDRVRKAIASCEICAKRFDDEIQYTVADRATATDGPHGADDEPVSQPDPLSLENGGATIENLGRHNDGLELKAQVRRWKKVAVANSVVGVAACAVVVSLWLAGAGEWIALKESNDSLTVRRVTDVVTTLRARVKDLDKEYYPLIELNRAGADPASAKRLTEELRTAVAALLGEYGELVEQVEKAIRTNGAEAQARQSPAEEHD